MKRWLRRSLAIAVGLGLGWYIAGWSPTLTRAQERHDAIVSDATPHATENHAATPAPPAPPAHQESAHPDGAAAHSQTLPHNNAAHPNETHASPAAMLVPQAYEVTWFPPVAFAAAGLFIAALILGIPAKRYATAPPPQAHTPASH